MDTATPPSPAWLDATNPCTGPCPVAHALSVVEGRWTALVIRELLSGTRRFTELRTGIGGVSAKVLTDRLRLMEQQGLIRRQSYDEIPPRVEYSLTDRGRSLEPVLRAMFDWGLRDLSEDTTVTADRPPPDREATATTAAGPDRRGE